MPQNKYLQVIKHPLVHLYITKLRDEHSGVQAFREAMDKLGGILGYHALSHVSTTDVQIQTPLEHTSGVELDKTVHVIPILRAGLSLVQGILHFVPNAKVGHIGVYRHHQTHEPINYYDNLPEGLNHGTCIVVDPMLATGVVHPMLLAT